MSNRMGPTPSPQESDQAGAASPDLICTIDPDNYFDYLSPAWEALLGFTPKELRAEPFLNFLHPDDVMPIAVQIQRLWAAPTRLTFECRFRGKDGVYQWGLWHATSVPGEHLIRASLHHLTERKQVQSLRAATETGAELRALLAAITDVILVLDVQGRYVDIAPTNPSLLYKPAAELIGKTLHEVLPREQADIFLGYLRRSLETGQTVHFEYRLPVGQAEVWFAATVSPMLADRVVWVARDITENKRAEEALRRAHDELEMRVQQRTAELAAANEALRASEALYHSLVETLPQSIFRKDREGRFTFANQRFCASVEKSVADIVGQTDFDLYPVELAQWHREVDRQVMETGQAYETIEEHQAPGGEKFYTQVVKTPVYDFNGDVAGTQCLFWDVTERRSAEEALRLSEARYRRQATRLQIATEVSRAVTSVLDPEALLARVADLIHERFGFYHAGVFLLDETGRWAVLRAASGEVGRQMVEQGHQIEVGRQGLVGLVSLMGEPQVAQDVSRDPARRFNPLLPDTRAEAAVPLRLGPRILGALDVQSTDANAFSDEDLAVLQGVADQVAVALENARLFRQTEASLRELDTLYRQYARQSWEAAATPAGGMSTFVYPREIAEADQPVAPLVAEAVDQRRTVSSSMEAGDETALAVPLMLRDQVIGALSFYDDAGRGTWSEDDRALIEAAAGQIAQSLEVARLFDRTSRQARREKLVGEITSKIRAANDIDSMLRTAVTELRQVLGVSHGAVRLSPGRAVRQPAPEPLGQSPEAYGGDGADAPAAPGDDP